MSNTVQTNYIPYDVANDTERGMKRSPGKLSILPVTWEDGLYIHFLWTTEIPVVHIYLSDQFGSIITQQTYASVPGETSLMKIGQLGEGVYTLHVCIGDKVYTGSFSTD